MAGKLTSILLVGALCLLGTTVVSARVDQYNSPSDYEQATGKKIANH